MITKKTNKVIDKLSKGSKNHEVMLKKRAILANPHYIDLTYDLLEWSLRCAMKNPSQQVAFVSSVNNNKVKYLLEYFRATRDEFRNIGLLKNLRLFNAYLDLNDKDITDDFVKKLKKTLNRNKRLSAKGGVIVIDSLDEVVFPLNLSAIPSNKNVMNNIGALNEWHKHSKYSVLFGSVTSPIPKELKQICGGYWDYQPLNNNEDNNYDDSSKH